ncbi:hypothetical protein KUCAC02_015717, partial [Chaenocephalus aceratus]
MASAHVSPLVTGSPWKQSGEGGDISQSRPSHWCSRLKGLHDCVLGMCSAGSSNVNILHPPSHSPVPGPGIPHPSNG